MRPIEKGKVVTLRLNATELELLQIEAKNRKLKENQTAKIVLIEALSGFDQKQETFLRRLDYIDDNIEQLAKIAALSAASAALPLDADQHDAVELREKLKIHFKHSSGLGDSILEMIKKGKL